MSVIQAANLHFESTSANRIVYTNEKINLISPNEIEIPQHLKVNGMNVKPTIQAAFLTANIAYAHANAAFNTANAALPNTSGVSFNGNLNFPTGNVGIGTTNPIFKLDVQGSLSQGIRVYTSNTSGTGIAYFMAEHGSGSTLQLRAGTGYTYLLSTSAVPLYMGTSSAIRMTVDPSGNVLIGRTDSTLGLGVKLDVNGSINVAALYVNGAPLQSGATIFNDAANATRYVTFVDATSGTMLKANVGTALTYNPSTGTLSSTLFNSTSDINKKENVIQITDALNILYQIDGVRFTWKDNGLPSLGVIAQQVEKVLPEIVENEKSVNYNGLIAVLIEAVKELKAEIEELKKNR